MSYIEYVTGVQLKREVNMGKYVVDGILERVPHKLNFPKLQDIPVGAAVGIEYNGCSFHFWLVFKQGLPSSCSVR